VPWNTPSCPTCRSAGRWSGPGSAGRSTGAAEDQFGHRHRVVPGQLHTPMPWSAAAAVSMCHIPAPARMIALSDLARRGRAPTFLERTTRIADRAGQGARAPRAFQVRVGHDLRSRGTQGPGGRFLELVGEQAPSTGVFPADRVGVAGQRPRPSGFRLDSTGPGRPSPRHGWVARLAPTRKKKPHRRMPGGWGTHHDSTRAASTRMLSRRRRNPRP